MTGTPTDPPVALSIAGTDSGGAAGLFADLTTFAALGVHGAGVVTAVTAQDTTGVHDVHAVPLDSVAAQLDAVLDDLPVAAVKTGMLGSAEVVALLADRLAGLPLVVDPVLVATSGAVLGDEAVRDAYLEHLLPVAAVVTPNLDEARALAGTDGPPERLAAALTDLGCAVVVTGGPDGPAEVCTDWLAVPGERPVPLQHPAVVTGNDHGTGCTFSAAFAALLSYRDPPNGAPLQRPTRGPETVELLRWIAVRAATYTARQLELSAPWTLGRGRGPIAHVTDATPLSGVSTGSTDERGDTA